MSLRKFARGLRTTWEKDIMEEFYERFSTEVDRVMIGPEDYIYTPEMLGKLAPSENPFNLVWICEFHPKVKKGVPVSAREMREVRLFLDYLRSIRWTQCYCGTVKQLERDLETALCKALTQQSQLDCEWLYMWTS